MFITFFSNSGWYTATVLPKGRGKFNTLSYAPCSMLPLCQDSKGTDAANNKQFGMILDDRLCAIAVMHIPVQDGNQFPVVLGCSRRSQHWKTSKTPFRDP